MPYIYVYGCSKQVCQQKLTDARRASGEDKLSLLDCGKHERKVI